jgi:hypothetical protein
MFKRLCGNEQLKNVVVVVTTGWDTIRNRSAAVQDAIVAERALMDSDTLLRELYNVGVNFFRTGKLGEEKHLQLAWDDRYVEIETPRAIVDRHLASVHLFFLSSRH